MNSPALFRFLLSAVCLGSLAWGLSTYPLPIIPVAAASAAAAALLWRWPAAFLLAVPAALPALDLGLWTGWMVVGEADFVILLALAVLLIRVPLRAGDLAPKGLAGAVFWLFAATLAISVLIGLTVPAADTANPFLAWTNGLRLAKGVLEAAALLPFLRQRQRVNGDGFRLLSLGLVLGLVAVTVEALIERDLFASILDFSSGYRVVAAFSSMRVGGGHIGACAALVLPFALVGCVTVQRLRWLPLAVLAAMAGGYTLTVTFARTAYLAGAAGCGVSGLTVLATAGRIGGTRGRWARAGAAVGVLIVLLGVGAAASSGAMRQRFAETAADLLTRESNWRAGWAARDPGVVTQLFGMGLGTYQRTMRARATANLPSDLNLGRDNEGRFLSMRVDSPFYLGQKIPPPSPGPMRLTLRFRAEDPRATLGFLVCDKMLVFSDQCRGGQARPVNPGAWESVSVPIDSAGLGRAGSLGFIHRPVELSLFDPVAGTALAVRDIQLTGADGVPLVTNGHFDQGLDRWLFTDDSHVAWRILNQYLMILFEGGVVGLLAWLALSGLALAGGLRAAARGEPAGAAVAGAITAFLVSGLFDNVLEAPRIATLFYLIVGMGLILWQGPEVPPEVETPDAPEPVNIAPVEEY